MVVVVVVITLVVPYRGSTVVWRCMGGLNQSSNDSVVGSCWEVGIKSIPTEFLFRDNFVEKERDTICGECEGNRNIVEIRCVCVLDYNRNTIIQYNPRREHGWVAVDNIFLMINTVTGTVQEDESCMHRTTEQEHDDGRRPTRMRIRTTHNNNTILHKRTRDREGG